MGIVLTPESEIACEHCKCTPKTQPRFWGPFDRSYLPYERWSCHHFTCRHREQFYCLKCYLDPTVNKVCVECGCEAEYC